MMEDNLEAARAKMARYRILKILDAGRPLPVGEGLIAQILVDADLQVTQMGIRRALQYLTDKGYVELAKPNGAEYWEARLMPKGVDYLEDAHIVDPGIARPKSV
jgi:repressor of nif and glnA expression